MTHCYTNTMKRYKRLAVYMDNGLLNINNNPIESSIRLIAPGRKTSFSVDHMMAQCYILSWEPANYMG
ncbi:IS66 family transposase [Pedobacter hartonius]|uniref:IS66 family transposase n=1 Tax=Pedobacter hartonius TaxID=425514 RepID=UPI00373FE354